MHKEILSTARLFYPTKFWTNFRYIWHWALH